MAGYFAGSASFLYFLANERGACNYANGFFRHITAMRDDFFLLTDFFESPDGLLQTITECLREPGTRTADLLLISSTGERKNVVWEFSSCRKDNDDEIYVQAVGSIQKSEAEILGRRIGKIADRYKAYEQSPEGLWRFESDIPVSINSEPDTVIEHWQKHSYLAECNNYMAQMYGYEKADDMVGKRLTQLIDFSAKQHLTSLKKFIQNGFRPTQVETREFDRYGNIKYFLNSMEGVIENGMISSVWGTQQDITEQRRAEELLKESELFYRNLFANSLDAVFITDQQGKIQFISPSVNSILGYTPEELTGQLTFEYAHPEDRPMAEKAFMDELKENSNRKFISVRIRNKQGKWVWCIVRGHNLLQNPHIRGMIVYLFDDTLRKKTEQALIESEKRLRAQAALLSNVSDVIVTTDMNRVITSWNSVIEKLSGINLNAAVGRPVNEIFDISYHPFTDKQVAGIVTTEGIWKGEVSFTGSDGEKKYLLHTISLLRDESGKETGMMEVGKDITERKKAEAQLQQSESFYRTLAGNSLDGILLTSKEGIIIHCAPSVRHISGYEVEQLLGKNIKEFIHPADQQTAMEAFWLELNRQSVLNYIVIRLLHATRGWVWCTVRGHNLLHNPVLNALVVYFTDDTKRKQIEDRLRESESRFRNMIHNLKLGVVLQNEKAEVLVCNNAALEMLGLTEEQLIGKTSFDPGWNVIHEDGAPFPGYAHPVPVAVQTKKPVRDVVMGVYRPLTHDRVWLLVNAEPIMDEEENILNVICSFADITEQRRMSQQLIDQEIQKQKLITQATIDAQEKERQEIGKELHDNINQHLTTTRLYLEVAAEKSKGDVLDLLNMANKNLANIVSEIRKLSQSLVPPTLGDIGLIESVQDLCDSLKRTHSFRINFLHPHFSESGIPDNMKLMIFRVIQEQVSNIIRHAKAYSITIKLQSDAEFIVFSIEDNGQGFDPQHHKKGMGLKNIANRVALFDGSVDIESSPGKGCSVTVSIPVPAVKGLFN